MYNISNFFVWFLEEFVRIGADMFTKLDNIILFGNVSLLDFTITIILIGAFIDIIITVPNAYNSEINRSEMERQIRNERLARESAKEEERYNRWWNSKR